MELHDFLAMKVSDLDMRDIADPFILASCIEDFIKEYNDEYGEEE